jgi:hypothetical protein
MLSLEVFYARAPLQRCESRHLHWWAQSNLCTLIWVLHGKNAILQLASHSYISLYTVLEAKALSDSYYIDIMHALVATVPFITVLSASSSWISELGLHEGSQSNSLSHTDLWA